MGSALACRTRSSEARPERASCLVVIAHVAGLEAKLRRDRPIRGERVGLDGPGVRVVHDEGNAVERYGSATLVLQRLRTLADQLRLRGDEVERVRVTLP